MDSVSKNFYRLKVLPLLINFYRYIQLHWEENENQENSNIITEQYFCTDTSYIMYASRQAVDIGHIEQKFCNDSIIMQYFLRTPIPQLAW